MIAAAGLRSACTCQSPSAAAPRQGGSLGRRLCAAGFAEPRRYGSDDDADVVLGDVLQKTRGDADPELARTVALRSEVRLGS